MKYILENESGSATQFIPNIFQQDRNKLELFQLLVVRDSKKQFFVPPLVTVMPQPPHAEYEG